MDDKKKSMYKYRSPHRLMKVNDSPTYNYYLRIFTETIEEAKKNNENPQIPIPQPTDMAQNLWDKLNGVDRDSYKRRKIVNEFTSI